MKRDHEVSFHFLRRLTAETETELTASKARSNAGLHCSVVAAWLVGRLIIAEVRSGPIGADGRRETMQARTKSPTSAGQRLQTNDSLQIDLLRHVAEILQSPERAHYENRL